MVRFRWSLVALQIGQILGELSVGDGYSVIRWYRIQGSVGDILSDMLWIMGELIITIVDLVCVCFGLDVMIDMIVR